MKTMQVQGVELIPKNLVEFKGNNYWFGGLVGSLKFELFSVIGRAVYRPDITKHEHKNLLNIGSGSRPFDEFVNLDFFRRRNQPEVMHDLRYPLPFPAERFEGVFSEHCFEHLSPLHAWQRLQDCFRILKPGGVIRLSLPSLQRVIQFYVNPKEDSYREFYAFGCEAIRDLTQNWGHVSVYDFEYLSYLVSTIGFVDIKECQFGESRMPVLAKEFLERRPSSFYLEASKPADESR